MAEYHVECGRVGIYAGTLNKKGDMWDVTDEAFRAVAQYCIEHNVAKFVDYHGKRYRITVEPQESESKE